MSKYTLHLLNDYCKEHSIELIGEYEKINRDSIIRGKCKCEGCIEIFEKNFRVLKKYDSFYCKYHLQLISTEKIKKQLIKYDYTWLLSKININLLLTDYSSSPLNAHFVIKSKCNNMKCNNVFEKKMCQLEQNTFCKKCNISIGKSKSKITNMERYGVENPFQNENIQTKIKHTNMEKYGVENPSQNEGIKQLKKDTCLKNHGVEHPAQNEEIRTKMKNTNFERFGVEHPLQNEEIQTKIKNTNMEKYGVESPFQNKEIQQKIKNTNLEKYGVEHPLQNEEIQNKIKNTNMERYGVERPLQNEEIQNKMKIKSFEKYGVSHFSKTEDSIQQHKNTCITKYGVECNLQLLVCKEKIKQTCLEKYGCEHPAQNEEIADKMFKNAYKLKDYILPSGNIIKIQGYEHYALDELFKDGILEEDIINGCSNVPEIWYNDEAGKKHRHYVDIFIPSQNRMIEVKSTWTAEKGKGYIFLKQEAGKKAGYLYEIWVYNGKGEKVECYI
jgi:hypothetical protein